MCVCGGDPFVSGGMVGASEPAVGTCTSLKGTRSAGNGGSAAGVPQEGPGWGEGRWLPSPALQWKGFFGFDLKKNTKVCNL